MLMISCSPVIMWIKLMKSNSFYTKLTIKDLGQVDFFLGVELHYTNKGILASFTTKICTSYIK